MAMSVYWKVTNFKQQMQLRMKHQTKQKQFQVKLFWLKFIISYHPVSPAKMMPKSRPSHRQSDRFELWWWWHGSSWIHLSKHLLTVEGTQNFGSLYRADPANAFTCHCTKKAPLGMVQHRKLTNVPLQKGKDRLSVPLSFRWHSFVFGGVYALSTNTV